MKRFLSRFAIMLTCLLLVIPLLAQDVELDAVYFSESGDLGFNYPDGWEVDDNGIVVTILPDDDAFETVEIEIFKLTPTSEIIFDIDGEMDADEALENMIDVYEQFDLDADDIEILEEGDNTVAYISGESSDNYFYVATLATPNGLLLGELTASDEDEAQDAEDIFVGILSSVKFNTAPPLAETDDGIELSQSFSSDEVDLSFDYPAGWDIDDQGETVTIFPDNDEFDDIESVEIDFFILNEDFQDEFGIELDMTAEEALEQVGAVDIEVIDLGDNTVASENIGDAIYSVLETPTGLILVQIIADSDNEIDEAEAIYNAILATVVLGEPQIVETVSSEFDLNETFTSDDDEYSVSYPDTWDVDNQDEFGMILFPDGDEYEDIDNISIIFLLVDDALGGEVGIQAGSSAQEALEALLNDPSNQVDVDSDDIVIQVLGSNNVATIEYGSYGDYIMLSILENNGTLLVAAMIGNEDQVAAGKSIYFAILATVELANDGVSDETVDEIIDEPDFDLSESFTSDNGDLTFAYPDGWDTSDFDTYVAINPSSSQFDDIEDVTIEFYFIDEEFGGLFDITVDTYIGFAAANIAEVAEDNGLSVSEAEKITIGEYEVIVLTTDNDIDIYLTAIIDTTNGILFAQLLGPEDQVEQATDIYYAIIETIEYEP